jgi:hypothetical protein
LGQAPRQIVPVQPSKLEGLFNQQKRYDFRSLEPTLARAVLSRAKRIDRERPGASLLSAISAESSLDVEVNVDRRVLPPNGYGPLGVVLG